MSPNMPRRVYNRLDAPKRMSHREYARIARRSRSHSHLPVWALILVGCVTFWSLVIAAAWPLITR